LTPPTYKYVFLRYRRYVANKYGTEYFPEMLSRYASQQMSCTEFTENIKKGTPIL